MVPFTTNQSPQNRNHQPCHGFYRTFLLKPSDQRSDIFVCELGGRIIEWQSHISVRTLTSHFHYLNGPIMGELKLLRYTSLFYTQLSPLTLSVCLSYQRFLQTRPETNECNGCILSDNDCPQPTSPSPGACVWTWSVNVFFPKTTLKTDKITPLYTEISWLLFSLITFVLTLYILFSG